jgi:uncharacterized membrane protein YedE/YeeE
MKTIISALVSGILFGAGLTLSQMANPEKVLNFLDIAGSWDPSLLMVMTGALTVTLICFRPILKRPKPLWDTRFYLAANSGLDKPLLIGAAIFGVGWGITGYCPGPAIAGLGLGNSEVLIIVPGICLGFFMYDFWVALASTQLKK